ncbi:MAG: MBL fold metallo-hydrolase [Acidimicrobiia bacterium]|nr:MBL fold metallo-hydrolase [Acidimicrobiia bacterium]
MTSLTQLAQGVYAWLADPPGHGRANAGVVIDADGLTLIDTLMVPSQVEPFAEEVEGFGYPIRRVVLTSPHIPYVGGSGRFWQAAFYGSEHTSEQLDLPPNVSGYRLLNPAFAAEFPDDLTTRPITHTVSEAAWLTTVLQVAPAPGETRGNLFAVAPGADVCFAGALCSFGVVPLGFEADFEAWVASLDAVAATATRVVPGQGPLGGEAEVRDLQAYLEACLDAGGDVSRLAGGPWRDWSHPEFHEVNVERAALSRAGEDRVPEAMLRLVGLA